MAVSSVDQREIIEVPYMFPDGKIKNHPALVVSVPELQEKEDGMFYAVLISTENFHPEYTIEIKPEDIVDEYNLQDKSYFVTHIVTYFLCRDVIQRKGAIVTAEKFNEVVQAVIDNIFGPEI